MSQTRILQNGRSTDNGVPQNGRARRRTNTRPGLNVSGGEINHQLEPDDLLDAELVAELRSSIDTVDGVVQFTIRNLLAWSDEARWELFSLLVNLDQQQLEYHLMQQIHYRY